MQGAVLWKRWHLVHLGLVKLVDELLAEVTENVLLMVRVHEGLTYAPEEAPSTGRNGPERVMDQREERHAVLVVGVSHGLAKVGPVKAMHEVRRNARLLLPCVDLGVSRGLLHGDLQPDIAHDNHVDATTSLHLVFLPDREAIRSDPIDRHGWLQDLDFRFLFGLLRLDFSGQQLG